MLTSESLHRLVAAVDSCPWGNTAGRHHPVPESPLATARATSLKPAPLYSPEERVRRDASPWTVVQGVLAPVQFIVFLVSLALVVNYLITGTGESAALFSIIVKTLVLYTIMITGAIWEHEIFGRYLFAPSFYWEDMVSMLVLALHTAYLFALFTGGMSVHGLMLLALAAYASYVINATQFVLKLRAARKQPHAWPEAALGVAP
jgi:3-vinyl bacteriochlorophyllide hydratase